jgi:hypothetical protein
VTQQPLCPNCELRTLTQYNVSACSSVQHLTGFDIRRRRVDGVDPSSMMVSRLPGAKILGRAAVTLWKAGRSFPSALGGAGQSAGHSTFLQQIPTPPNQATDKGLLDSQYDIYLCGSIVLPPACQVTISLRVLSSSNEAEPWPSFIRDC